MWEDVGELLGFTFAVVFFVAVCFGFIVLIFGLVDSINAISKEESLLIIEEIYGKNVEVVAVSELRHTVNMNLIVNGEPAFVKCENGFLWGKTACQVFFDFGESK